jgi:multiple sugar transport system substrate-binding protein
MSPMRKPAFFRLHWFLVGILTLISSCTPRGSTSEPFDGQWTAAFKLETNTGSAQTGTPWFTFIFDLQQEGKDVNGTIRVEGMDASGVIHGTVDEQGVLHGTMRMSWDDHDWESLKLSLLPDGASGTGTAIYKAAPNEIHLYSINLLPAGSTSFVSPTHTSAPSTPIQKAHIVWLEDSHGWLVAADDYDHARAKGWVTGFNDTHDDIELELYTEHGGINMVDEWLSLHEKNVAISMPMPNIGLFHSSRDYAQWDVWLDMVPYLQGYDLSVFHPSALRDWQDKDGKQFGLPVTVYGPMLIYNRDLFDAAGIPYPPHRYGEPYADGDEWNIEKMEEIAILLTLDANGRNPTHPDFNAQEIVQFGFTPQWLQLVDMVSLFGTDSVFDASGPVSVPDSWREALHWYHAGMWEKHFIPTTEQANELGGNAFDSGRVAMAYSQTWYFCCIKSVLYWDLAALPSHNGRVTASVVSDGAGILEISPQPQAAVEALYYLATLPELDYRQGFPALNTLQEARYAALEEQFPQGVDWQVAKDSLIVPEFALHPFCAPRSSGFGYQIEEFLQNMTASPLPDLETAIDELEADLHATMQEWEKLSCL